jgi:putative SOS response-associated peptidase YedK
LTARIHDRMPAILPSQKIAEWLSAPSSYLLRPAPEGVLVATEVSNRANSISHDDPACLEPWRESDKGQIKLL